MKLCRHFYNRPRWRYDDKVVNNVEYDDVVIKDTKSQAREKWLLKNRCQIE